MVDDFTSNETMKVLLGRRSVRSFSDRKIDGAIIDAMESAAQRAASSQYLNDWSAIRIEDPELKAELAKIGGQAYIAQAPLLYVFVLDEYRNAVIAQSKGVDIYSDAFTLRDSYRFSQAQNDTVLALHAMETAAESFGLGCVILGSILADIPRLIELLNLPEYTYPVLGLALGYPAPWNEELKPRMAREDQFFVNGYDVDPERILEHVKTFDEQVHQYYDERDTSRPVDPFSDQVAEKAVATNVLNQALTHAKPQGFHLDR